MRRVTPEEMADGIRVWPPPPPSIFYAYAVVDREERSKAYAVELTRADARQRRNTLERITPELRDRLRVRRVRVQVYDS
jgi:hypothetical protein